MKNQPGTTISDVDIQNNAVAIPEYAIPALMEAARAAAANAEAIGKIASALAGAQATMPYGIYIAANGGGK